MSVATAWQNCNHSTKEFLQAIPEDDYRRAPLKNRFKTFVWEFACILRTRLCYIDAFKTGKLDFSTRKGIKDKLAYESLAQEEMSKLIHDTGVVLTEVLRKQHDEAIASWLVQHERLHHGKLMLYMSLKNMELPAHFKKTWGETNFSNND